MAFSDRSMSGARPRWVTWLPVAALLIGIVAHATLMQTVNADRQGGSAFAMFSSVDFANSRQVIADGTIDGEVYRIVMPAALVDDSATVRRAPTDSKADDLAASLRGLSWSIDDGQLTAGGETQLDLVTVKVFGLTADGRTLGQQAFAEGSSS